MKKSILFVVVLILTQLCSAQNTTSDSTFSAHSLLFDALEHKNIPFVSVHISHSQNGTISDFNGNYSLNGIRSDDTLVFYIIGFEKKFVSASKALFMDTIFMFRETQLLDQVMVVADDAFLFNLVSGCRKHKPKKHTTAKTYLELETFHGDHQLELIQSYYNGIYHGYDVNTLEVKNTRVGLSPISKRLFASFETARAIYQHKLIFENDYFPESPFEISRKMLRKNFHLSLVSKYRDKKKKTIYVIKYLPKENPSKAFQGRVWIDSASNMIIKVDLNIEDASIYPFLPIWSDHKLSHVNMNISKSFVEINGEMIVKSINFDYGLGYHSKTDSLIKISTRAILYAYNYDAKFNLPLFKFQGDQFANSELHKLSIIAFDTSFWQCNNEFTSNSNKIEHDLFLQDSTTISVQDLLTAGTVEAHHGFFHHSYVFWNGKKRVQLKVGPEIPVSHPLTGVEVITPAQRYDFNAQIYLDINVNCDSVTYSTSTIFDPYQSFYRYPSTPMGHAFANIYFDLMEIKRRELNEQLDACHGNIGQMKIAFHAMKIDMNRLKELYFKEVQRGTETVAFQKWNDLVLKELNIDNIKLFDLYQD